MSPPFAMRLTPRDHSLLSMERRNLSPAPNNPQPINRDFHVKQYNPIKLSGTIMWHSLHRHQLDKSRHVNKWTWKKKQCYKKKDIDIKAEKTNTAPVA